MTAVRLDLRVTIRLLLMLFLLMENWGELDGAACRPLTEAYLYPPVPTALVGDGMTGRAMVPPGVLGRR